MERLGGDLTLPGDRRDGREGQAVRRTVRERAAKVIAKADALDDIELMSAEAIANAVLHGSGDIRITVATDGFRLRVEVRDEGPRYGDAYGQTRINHGRGLTVIDALASEWGFDGNSRETRLWFEVEP